MAVTGIWLRLRSVLHQSPCIAGHPHPLPRYPPWTVCKLWQGHEGWCWCLPDAGADLGPCWPRLRVHLVLQAMSSWRAVLDCLLLRAWLQNPLRPSARTAAGESLSAGQRLRLAWTQQLPWQPR